MASRADGWRLLLLRRLLYQKETDLGMEILPAGAKSLLLGGSAAETEGGNQIYQNRNPATMLLMEMLLMERERKGD